MMSVIIPSYNSEKTINNCLEALQSQTFKDIEIIVIDDGSNDGTASIIKSFKNVKFFKKSHKGPASARNFGAKMAKGKILLFTDSDCEPDKNWVAEMAAPFSDKTVAGVSGTYRTRQKELIARFAQYEIEERHQNMAESESIDFIGTFSAGYRKDIFVKFGGFDESFSTSAGEDPELSFRLAEKGYKMVFTPNAFVYHTHPNTLKKFLRQKYRNSYWRVMVYQKRKATFRKGHSYTPTSALIEAVCAAAFLASLFFYIIFPTQGYKAITAGFLFLTFLPSIALTCYISKKDIAVGIISPFIIMLRAFATAFGIMRGLFKRYVL